MTQPSILIVDDDNLFRELILTQLAPKLTQIGLEGVIVDGMAEAKPQELFSYEPGQEYSLYIIDYELPIIKGDTFASMVKTCSRNNPSIICVTAHNTRQMMPDLLGSGFDEVISKPVRLNYFAQVCKNYLQQVYK